MSDHAGIIPLSRHFAPRLSAADFRFKRIYKSLLAGWGLAALVFVSAPVLAATAPDLGSTEPYAIVSGTFTNTSAETTIDGDVCYTTPPAVPPMISGATVVPCPAVTGTDQNAARADLLSQTCTPIGAAVALNEISIDSGTPGEFPPGCYSSTGAMSITAGTTVTLSGSGVYIFRPGGSLDPAANSAVVLAGGACADDVFWAPEGATTIGANVSFIGNIFRGTADGLSITFGDSSSLDGRALAFGSTATTDNTAITVPAPCDELNTITVNKDFLPGSNATVSVDLSCSSGTVATTPLNASETEPAVFTVNDALPGTTCTATETVPEGYTADQTDCEQVALGDSCTITNTLNDNSIVVHKDFLPDSDATVSVELSCSSGTVTSTSPDASEGSPAVFTVTGADPGATCTATETVPEGYTADQTDCEAVAVGSSCTITNSLINEPGQATFRVTKDFTDGNPMDVEVTLTCTTGLPLIQDTTISEGNDVVFVITSFTAGELDCVVSEEVPAGYSPGYTASATTGVGLFSNDDQGCHFEDIDAGDFVCEIVNTPALVPITIVKEWVIEGNVGDSVDTRYSLRLECEKPIGLVDVVESDISATFIVPVVPQYPDTDCWVEETVFDSAVEVDNGCKDLKVSAALGSDPDPCLITNTVIFEGIPTLSQYGMAILALLMLGAGLAGFRRLV